MSYRRVDGPSAPFGGADLLAGRIESTAPRQIVWIDAFGRVATADWTASTGILRRGPVPGRVLAHALQDVDSDGVRDIITVHGGDTATVRWISGGQLADAEGLVADQVVEMSHALGGPARAAVLAHIDGDAWIDAVVLGTTGAVFVAGVTGTPTASSTLENASGLLGAMRRPHSHRSVVLATDSSGALLAHDLLSADVETLVPASAWPMTVSGGTPTHVGDFDGDGVLDILLLPEGAPMAVIARRAAQEGPVPPSVAEIGFATRAASLGDLDLDGLDELVVADERGRIVAMGRPGEGGDGRMAQSELAGLGLDPPIVSIAIHDLDRDGLPDVLGASESGRVGILVASCGCDAGWSGSRCSTCEQADCGSAGGNVERVWLSVPARVRRRMRDVAKELATIAGTGGGGELSVGQIMRLQELASVALQADLTVVARASGTIARPSAHAAVAEAEREIEFTLTVDRVVTGDPGGATELLARTPDPALEQADAPPPPPEGARVLVALSEEENGGWSLSPLHWPVTADGLVELGSMQIPVHGIADALRAAMEAP